MKVFCKSRADVVEFVTDQIHTFGQDWPLIMTITPEKSEGYCVRTATDTLSVVTEALPELAFWDRQLDI